MSITQLSYPLAINVKQYGVTGDGATDDTANIQACLNAATAGTDVVLPAGIYIITATLLFPGNIRIRGAGDSDNGTIIRVKTGAALTTPILASKDWNSNTATCGNPVHISDIKLDANSAMSGSSAHGLVLYNFWSTVDKVSISGVTGHGLYFTAHSKNGTHISNTCTEVKIRQVQVRTPGQHGIYIHDSENPLASCTDGFLEDCIVQSAGQGCILIESGAGWLVQGNHVYGSVIDAIYLQKCYATRVIGNYVDGYGSGSSTFIAGVGVDVIDGRPTLVMGNTVNSEGGAATGPYQNIRVTGNGSARATCCVIGNHVQGGSQSGSIGYVLQAQGGQVGQPWFIWFVDNDVVNAATAVYNDGNTTGGGLNFNGKITSTGDAPVLTAGSNNGGTPPTPTFSGSGNDSRGLVQFGSGTTAAAGNQAVVTFNKVFASAPIVAVSPANDATQQLGLSYTVTTAALTFVTHTAPANSQSVGTYKASYHIIG
jgi:hypothetical protein